jgi:hypothetical protein
MTPHDVSAKLRSFAGGLQRQSLTVARGTAVRRAISQSFIPAAINRCTVSNSP